MRFFGYSISLSIGQHNNCCSLASNQNGLAGIYRPMLLDDGAAQHMLALAEKFYGAFFPDRKIYRLSITSPKKLNIFSLGKRLTKQWKAYDGGRMDSNNGVIIPYIVTFAEQQQDQTHPQDSAHHSCVLYGSLKLKTTAMEL